MPVLTLAAISVTAAAITCSVPFISSCSNAVWNTLLKWAALDKHMLRMQIYAWDHVGGGGWVCGGGGRERSSLRAEQNTGYLHAVLGPRPRAPIINNSCPCYVNSALKSTSPQNSTHSGAATCRPVDCTAVSLRDQRIILRLTIDKQRVA